MRIQLDTKLKTIRVEETVNLGEFVKAIKKILPDWEDYKIEQSFTTTYYPYYPIQYQNIQNPVDFGVTNGSQMTSASAYNLQIN